MLESRFTHADVALSDFIAHRTPAWVRLLQDLIRIPSSTPAGDAAICEFVARHIESLGVQVLRVPHEAVHLRSLSASQPPYIDHPGRCSLAVRVPGRGHGASLALNTHLDTVPVGNAASWTKPPLEGLIDADVVYGRGAMDDKAGVAISLAVLETASAGYLPHAGDLVFHYVLEDETTGNGTLLCLRAGHTADAAVIIDGTRIDRAVDRHAGNVQFELSLTGKPASVSVSHMGINAAELLARLLLELRDMVHSLNVARVDPWTQFPSPNQFVIQRLHSDGEQLTVPVSAAAQCYATFIPPLTLGLFRTMVERHACEFGERYKLPEPIKIRWDGLFATEPVESVSPSFARELNAAAARREFQPIAVGPSTGTSDLRHFAAAGIPCVLYGPGRGFNPHRADEHYFLEDLPKMVGFFLDFAGAMCDLADRFSTRRAA